MIITESNSVPLDKCPALVLNADYRPLSYYPLSLWCWQDVVRDVFLDRVTIVSEYDREIRSPSFSMKLPSVISLKKYIKPSEFPNFTRFNVFLRDRFSCQGGATTLDNFDMLSAIVEWVENGKAPAAIIATGRSMPGVSRPLCPHPQYAHYSGAGASTAAESFTCTP